MNILFRFNMYQHNDINSFIIEKLFSSSTDYPILHSQILLLWFRQMYSNKLHSGYNVECIKFIELLKEYHLFVKNLNRQERGADGLTDVKSFIKQFKPFEKNQFDSILGNPHKKYFIGSIIDFYSYYPKELFWEAITKKTNSEELQDIKDAFQNRESFIEISCFNLEIINPFTCGKLFDHASENKKGICCFGVDEFNDNVDARLFRLTHKNEKECFYIFGNQYIHNKVDYTEHIFLTVMSSIYSGLSGDFTYNIVYDKSISSAVEEFTKIAAEVNNFDYNYGVGEYGDKELLPMKWLGIKKTINQIISELEDDEDESRELYEIVNGDVLLAPEERNFIRECKIPIMEYNLRKVSKIINTKTPILLLGETGTGKTRMAKIIHENSNRKEKKFVELNCAAIPPGLIESELFGHVKGAFTGATSNKVGKIKEADGGTLFLDEITAAPLGLQDKLLTFIESKKIRRVGDLKEDEVNVRIICATNRSIKEAFKDKLLRPDFYYRIANFWIELPPLRKSIQVRKYAEMYSNEALEIANVDMNVNNPRFTDDALTAISQFEWPGNFRQLINTLRICLADCLLKGINEIDEEILRSNYFEEMSESKLEDLENLLERFFREWLARNKEIEFLRESDIDPDLQDAPINLDFMKGFLEPVAINMFLNKFDKAYKVHEKGEFFGMSWSGGIKSQPPKIRKNYKYIKEIFGE